MLLMSISSLAISNGFAQAEKSREKVMDIILAAWRNHIHENCALPEFMPKKKKI